MFFWFFTVYIWSFDIAPTYSFFSSSEQENIASPLDNNAEYQSDRRTFRLQEDRQSAWYKSSAAYLATIGSLDSRTFLLQEKFKYEKQADQNTKLSFYHLRQKEAFYSLENQILDFSYQFIKHWHLALVGNIKSQKKDIDMGIRLRRDWANDHYTDFLLIYPDFSYNKRSENTDRMQKKAYNITVFGKKYDEYEYFLRYQSKIKWQLDSNEQLYGLEYYHVGFQNKWREHFIKIEYDNKIESRDHFSDDSLDAYWDLDRYQYVYKNKGRYFVGNGQIYIGIEGKYLKWKDLNNDKIHQNSHMPFIAYEWARAKNGRIDLQNIEYEQSHYWLQDSKNALSKGVSDYELEHRLNYRYTFKWQEQAELSILVTFDLDSLNKSPWEGGGGHLLMYF